MKQIRIFVFAALTAVMLAASAGAVETVKAFSDVPETHWAHSAIMTMVRGGLFNGKTAPVDGIGTFAPDAPMTRAEFVTVLTRLLYADRITDAVNEGPWWQKNYETALNAGLLYPEELDGGALDQPMQRQEAAMVLVRSARAKGFPTRLAGTGAIADYETVAESYREYVRICFALGILQGVDAQGSFQPQGTLTRAQAATVIFRLVDGQSRNPLPDGETEFVNTAGVPQGENLTDIAGQLAVMEDDRPALKSKKLVTARKTLNKYLKEVYGYQFFEGGIAVDEESEGEAAKLIQHEKDKRLGLEVTIWRGDYNSTGEQSIKLNLILEAMVYLSGDPEVGYALWSWKDAANINGMAYSEDFGFEDVASDVDEDKRGVSIIAMNGVEVEVDNSETDVTRYYFSKA
ncbi:MAG: S-layer homology domain-containing protein [Oscillibacter sp.]|nr:S-layer homology domain-containing protein [Oscillibacter sp.]